MSRRDLVALVLLTDTLVRRLLREGLVLRSLVWPAALTVGTLLVTLGLAGVVRQSTAVAVPRGIDAAVLQTIAEAEWEPLFTDDPRAAVVDGEAWAGTDGHTVYFSSAGPDVLRLEAALRTRAPWRPAPERRLPPLSEAQPQGTLFSRMLAVLYTLYGVVFGLGMVARDRDDGSLEAELSLPIPHWISGAARWIAGTVILTLFYGLCVALFHAMIGVEDPGAMLRHGLAACAAATTVGLSAVGTAGTRQGFSGPLAAGLTAATGGIALGMAVPGVGQWLPLASVFAGGSGWVPACVAVASGGLASMAFAWRSARS